MQSLLLSLAIFGQNPQEIQAPPARPEITSQNNSKITIPLSPQPMATAQAPSKQPPAPSKMPPIPGKTLPAPQTPAKVQVVPQAPGKTLPAPQAPGKTLPAPQAPGKTLPAPQAPAKLLPSETGTTQAVTPTTQEVLGPEQQVFINQYGCYCVGQKVLKGQPDCVGKWRVKYRVNTPQGAYTYKAQGYGAQSYASYGSAGAFLAQLNATRAQYGLPAVGYDPNLENWAATNNAQQAARGIGHFVMGPARRQNAAMAQDVTQVHNMWMASPGHRSAMLDPTISAIGLAQNGQWWTMNAY